MVSAIISRVIILVFGTLYPAYASYKAVKTKNVKEYVKWMMYWIVFALFITAETFADVLLSWIPFYYELKIVFVIWMLSPATKGSSILYRKFVHPQLMKREQDIDDCIEKASNQGYTAIVKLGTQGINMAIKTAITSQSKIFDQLKRSYSMSDVDRQGRETPADSTDGFQEADENLGKETPADSTDGFQEADENLDNRFIEEERLLREHEPIEEEMDSAPRRRRVRKDEDEDYVPEDMPRMTTSRSYNTMNRSSNNNRGRDKNEGLRRAYSHKETKSTTNVKH